MAFRDDGRMDVRVVFAVTIFEDVLNECCGLNEQGVAIFWRNMRNYLLSSGCLVLVHMMNGVTLTNRIFNVWQVQLFLHCKIKDMDCS